MKNKHEINRSLSERQDNPDREQERVAQGFSCFSCFPPLNFSSNRPRSRKDLSSRSLETDLKGKGLLSPKEMKQLRGKSIGVDGKQIVLSDGSTSEKPDLDGGMWRGEGDRMRASSRSLDIIRMMMDEETDMAQKLDQAHQKLDQAHQEIRDKEKIIKYLAKQLEEARLGGTSSLHKGESSSQVINWEDVTPWRKYYEPHGFAQIPKGEEWFDKNIDKWVFMPHGSEYMKENAHLLIATAPGAKWFEKKGEQWIESWDGRIFMSANAHLLIATAPGAKWFKEKGDEWIKRDDGRSFMRRKAHLLLITDPGASWFEEKGDEWIESENSRSFMRENAHLLIATAPGRRWFEEKGVEWLRSEDGQLYRSSHDGSQNEFRELNAWYRNKIGNSLIWGHHRYDMYI